MFGLPYWSLSRWIKLKVKNAVNFIGEFEKTLSGEARRHHVDGVICGHIHHPVIRMLDGLIYVNCGDWVESCTAAVEHFDGQLQIIEWAKTDFGPRSPDDEPLQPMLMADQSGAQLAQFCMQSCHALTSTHHTDGAVTSNGAQRYVRCEVR